jgi:putative transposase
MNNHYHLLIETVDANLSAGMRQLNGIYTQSFNRKYKRVGHLFQGRYKSIHVERETYLLELRRYIVLNPVRAGIVSSPGEFSWSSYKATAGLTEVPPFLTVSWILNHFENRKLAAQKKYRLFVDDGIDHSSPWKDLKAQCILGNNRFIERLKKPLQSRSEATEIPKNQRFIARPLLKELFHPKELNSKALRNKAIQKAYLTYRYTQIEISKHLGLHYSTISRLLKEKMSK